MLKRKKTKSGQSRFLKQHGRELKSWLRTDRFPACSTYSDRYRRAHRLFRHAIKLQGEKAIAYQLLVRCNDRCGNHNGPIRWILDTL